MEDVFDQKITVHGFTIMESKWYKEEGVNECLQMQIEIDGKMRVLFNGSKKMIDQLKQVPDNGFPFQTIIKKVDKKYMLT